jgi:hypothetical protein
MPRLTAGDHPVEGAVRLDAIPGRETMFAVLCAAEADAARAQGALAAALKTVGTAGELPRLDLPCEQARAVLVKEAGP